MTPTGMVTPSRMVHETMPPESELEASALPASATIELLASASTA